LGGTTNYWGNAYIDAVNANTVSAVGNVTGGNLSTAGLTSTTDFSITGNVTGHLVPSANGVYSLGSPDQLWSNLYLTGNTITLGSQTLSSNTATVTTSNNFQAANINALYNITTIVLSASGNVTGGNLRTGGLASVAGNVTSGNVNTAGTVTATGNVIGGNLLTGGLISATANVTGGNFITSGLISATSTITSAANITGGNVLTGGQISAVANVTGGNLLTSGYLSVVGNATIDGDLSVTGNIIGVLQDHGSDSNNWDAITRMGTYTVNRVSWAGTIGTPLDSQVFVGLLEVLNSANTAISQVFYPGTIETGNVNIQWNRANWANSWSPWIKIINNDQIVSGGEF
jgi:filamentous hemagglutinin